MKKYDVIVIGAGAAGLSAAATAVQNGARVAVLDMGRTPARKVLASGGGRCNITNTAAAPGRYFSKNPNFVRGAFSRVSPHDILDWAIQHDIVLYEKTPGRYFCRDGANMVVDALLVDAGAADVFLNQYVERVEKSGDCFCVNGFMAPALVVATGGVSWGTLGVSDLGYKIAKQFGHKIVPPRPGLCALAITGFSPDMAGVSLPVQIIIGKNHVNDSLLFTHFGIGGPAAYRASLYAVHDGIRINLMSGADVFEILKQAKQTNGRRTIGSVLGDFLPNRVVRWRVGNEERRVADIKDAELMQIAQRFSNVFIPGNKIKYHALSSAEVTFGGVDLANISSKTMESKLCPGLFFAGEVMDITGDLGGFNLQWAWASGRVAGVNAAMRAVSE